jgi:anti-anti-sigma regulatory factor
MDWLPPKIERTNGVIIITFAEGRIRDMENMLSRELDGLTDDLHATHVLLDFCDVKQVTSVELGTLIGLHKKMEAADCRLTLFNLNSRVYEAFVTNCLDKFFAICREEANPPSAWID